MPNPFEPPKPSPLAFPPTHPPPPPPPPDFLPPSSFNTSEWPTWSALETPMHALIANAKPGSYYTNNNNNSNNNNNRYNNTSNHHATSAASSNNLTTTTPQRKRRPSKLANGSDTVSFVPGEQFGISEATEALRAKVEADRVVRWSLEWRGVAQAVERKGGMGDSRDWKGDGVEGGGSGKDDRDGDEGGKQKEALGAKGANAGTGKEEASSHWNGSV